MTVSASLEKQPEARPGAGEISTQAVTVDEVWALWRKLAGAFGPWRTLRAAVMTKASFGFYGVDFVSSLRRTPMVRLAADILKNAPDAALEPLAEIAEVNAQRNDAMWRIAVIFYVSVPLTLVLTAMEALPDFARIFFRESPASMWIAAGLLTLFLLYYVLTQWRGRQIVAALRLLMIERRLAG